MHFTLLRFLEGRPRSEGGGRAHLRIRSEPASLYTVGARSFVSGCRSRRRTRRPESPHKPHAHVSRYALNAAASSAQNPLSGGEAAPCAATASTSVSSIPCRKKRPPSSVSGRRPKKHSARIRSVNERPPPLGTRKRPPPADRRAQLRPPRRRDLQLETGRTAE